MAVLTNDSGSPRDVWTESGWTHFPIGAAVEVELSDAQVKELLDLGFSKPKAADKPRADDAK